MIIPNMDKMDDLEILSWYMKKVVEVGRMENREERNLAGEKLLAFKQKMNERFKQKLNKQKSTK